MTVWQKIERAVGFIGIIGIIYSIYVFIFPSHNLSDFGVILILPISLLLSIFFFDSFKAPKAKPNINNLKS